VQIQGASDPSDPDVRLDESGALLPGPDAIRAGPTFQAWLDAGERVPWLGGPLGVRRRGRAAQPVSVADCFVVGGTNEVTSTQRDVFARRFAQLEC
jgi:hypothetical protein